MTGGGRGIGRAVALALGRAGATLVLTGRTAGR
ncbi:MAG: 2,4-dienoyl-CoA reductase, partial [Candidatus Rokuibacteriota bacterium]